MPLDDPKLGDLLNLIRDSFRVHPNADPVYVDVSSNLNRLAAKQHQVIFGRRGSGKSCLLVHYHRSIAHHTGVLSVYLNADDVKQLKFPDLLIRVLITLLEQLPGARPSRFDRFLRRKNRLATEIEALRRLLDSADDAELTRSDEREDSRSSSGSISQGPGTVEANVGQRTASRTTESYRRSKIDHLERHIQDYKQLIDESISGSEYDRVAFLVDDFYLILRDEQPDLVDYLHRLCRGTSCYLKIGTVQHRTTLLRHNGQTIGIELSQDVEQINLDRTLEDVALAQDYLIRILQEMGKEVGIDDTATEYLNADAPLALTLASGGVPRDFLSIFVEAAESARQSRENARWITPTNVYRAAARNSYRTKTANLRSDVREDGALELETMFNDLVTFCLKEKRKTAFLISQADIGSYSAEHDLILQLMDLKLLHVIEPDTSAASGRQGRFEAYTLDVANFMEPRRRGIEIVEFWKKDDQRRPLGLREAPVFPLSRARAVLSGNQQVSIDSTVDEIESLPAE